MSNESRVMGAVIGLRDANGQQWFLAVTPASPLTKGDGSGDRAALLDITALGDLTVTDFKVVLDDSPIG